MTRTIFLVLTLAVALGACQTFQYSRGWTNGKRAGGGASIVSEIVDDKYANNNNNNNDAPVEVDNKPVKILAGDQV